jgi:hypothetical protein
MVLVPDVDGRIYPRRILDYHQVERLVLNRSVRFSIDKDALCLTNDIGDRQM